MAKSTRKAGGTRGKVVKKSARVVRGGAQKKAARPKTARVASKRVAPARPPARAVSRPAAPAPASAAVAALAKRIVDLTVRGDDEASFALYAPNVESREMGVPPTIGVDALREKFAMWRTMTKEASWQAKNVWTFGNTIVIEWDGRVTLASGNTVDMREVAIHEVENGKIARERFYYDRSIFQAGPAEAQPAAPPPAPPADLGS